MNWQFFLSGWIPPPPVSTFGPSIDTMYYVTLWITGIIFVLTEVALLIFSIRYRHSKGRKAHYTHGNTVIEIIWTTIPAFILIILGITSQNLWAKLRQPNTFPKPAVVIRVTGEQWLWHFKYAGPDNQFDTEDDISVDNAFHIPLQQPVQFELKAQDVIHGFYLPDFRLHQDVVPGLTSTLWMQGTKAGTYDVRCTQFCGTNHYEMKGQITVDEPAEFQAWLAHSKEAAF